MDGRKDLGNISMMKSLSYWYRPVWRRIWRIIQKPALKYVEFHLTDHCNLNCKGCGHFCPIADEWFAEVGDFAKDIKRLAYLFDNIMTIRLMGGEPLLHPKVNEFMAIARANLPNTTIRLATNGILLEKMQDDFWHACKEHGIVIDVTRYPILLKFDRIKELAIQKKVEMHISSEVGEFLSAMNSKGDSNPMAAMKRCRAKFYCPFLKDGKLYACAIPALAGYFNHTFKTAIPTEGGINIHDKKTNGWKIIDALEKPVSACYYCATECRSFAWGVSKKQKDEWVACKWVT
jgi:organic radical activating enzyme